MQQNGKNIQDTLENFLQAGKEKEHFLKNPQLSCDHTDTQIFFYSLLCVNI